MSFLLRIWSLLRGRRRDVFYIGGAAALPPPLTAEEEKALLKELCDEDESVKKAARAALIERNLRLVVYIARKFENAGINVEDLISIGTIGLIKAVDTFDVCYGSKFSSSYHSNQGQHWD